MNKGETKAEQRRQTLSTKKTMNTHVVFIRGIIGGARDTPYRLVAADYMIDDAAHLPNMDQPDEFRRVVTAFLDSLRH